MFYKRKQKYFELMMNFRIQFATFNPLTSKQQSAHKSKTTLAE